MIDARRRPHPSIQPTYTYKKRRSIPSLILLPFFVVSTHIKLHIPKNFQYTPIHVCTSLRICYAWVHAHFLECDSINWWRARMYWLSRFDKNKPQFVFTLRCIRTHKPNMVCKNVLHEVLLYLPQFGGWRRGTSWPHDIGWAYRKALHVMSSKYWPLIREALK